MSLRTSHIKPCWIPRRRCESSSRAESRVYSNGQRPYANYSFSRSPAECSAISLCRQRYGRRYRRRSCRLRLVISRARRIYMAQVTNILGTSADPGHPSRSSRRRRHGRPRWVVGNDGGGVFAMLVILRLSGLRVSTMGATDYRMVFLASPTDAEYLSAQHWDSPH